MANPNITAVSSIYFQNAGFQVQSTAEAIITVAAVSYTHLTLPTNREV